MLQRNYAGDAQTLLALCTEIQRRRFLLYTLEHSLSPEEAFVLQKEQIAHDWLLNMLDKALSQINAETIIGNMNSVIFLGGRKHTHNKGIIRSFKKRKYKSLYWKPITRAV